MPRTRRVGFVILQIYKSCLDFRGCFHIGSESKFCSLGANQYLSELARFARLAVCRRRQSPHCAKGKRCLQLPVNCQLQDISPNCAQRSPALHSVSCRPCGTPTISVPDWKFCVGDNPAIVQAASLGEQSRRLPAWLPARISLRASSMIRAERVLACR